MRKRIRCGAATLAVLSILAAGCSATTTTPPNTPSAGTTPASSVASRPAAEQTAAAAPQQPIAPEKNPPGDIPDTQVFVAYSAAGGFSLKVPEGWSRQAGASSAAFTDKLNTIQVAWSPAGTAPTVASVTSVDVPQLKSTAPAFELRSIKAVSLLAGPAVLLIYRENGEPNAVTGKRYRLDVQRYTIFRNGTRVDLTLLSPVGADNVDPWRVVSQSLKWK